MINIYTTTLNKIKSISLLLFLLVLTSCGTFNSVDYTSNDGIYDGRENVSTASSNGVYYKDYFDQKAQEYGLNTTTNDSIITDINSYSSATNTDITYNNSYGSWGDSPDSINIKFRDRNFMGAYMSNYYSPFYMNSWYMNPWGYNFYSPFNYPYGGYGRYSYWDYMFNPYGYGRYGGNYDSFYYLNNHNSNFRNNDKGTAYINGRRISGSSNSNKIADLSGNSNTSMDGRDISNYNVGRNELDVNDSSNSDKSSDEINKSRDINRIYYSLKNLGGNFNSRGYQNKGEINNGGVSNTNSRSYERSSNGKSNFQLSRKRSNGNSVSNSNSSNKRSYDVSRTSNGNQNSKSSNNKSYNVSRSSSNSNNSSSRSSYSPPPVSRSSSSTSSSSRSSVGASKGRR